MSSPPRISAYQKLHGTQSSSSQTADKTIEPAAENSHSQKPATSMIHQSTQQASSPPETASPRACSEETIASKEDAAHNQSRTPTHSTNPKPTPPLEEPPMPSIERDDESVEETITTDAARLAFPSCGKLSTPVKTSSRSPISDRSNSLNNSEDAVAGYSNWEGSDDDLNLEEVQISEASEDTVTEPEESLLVPGWFPKNIKKIYETDHHGGALFFKVITTPSKLICRSC